MMAEKEKYTELVGSHKGDRTQYALYGQYTVQVNDRYKNIFGLRYQYSSDQVKRIMNGFHSGSSYIVSHLMK